jgi:Family of unknown function (DUF5362)
MENQHTFQLTYSPSLLSSLKTIAFWAKLSAIISFCSAGVSLLAGLKDIATLIGGLVGIAISVLINIFLFKFGNCVQQGINTNDLPKIGEGFANLKTYYKIYGIILIVMLSFVVLVMVFAVLAGILGSAFK